MSWIHRGVFVIGSVVLSGCGQHPRIDVAASIEDEKVVINVSFTQINGISALIVSEGEKTLWSVTTSYENGHKFVYGEVPKGGNMPAQQTNPPVGEHAPNIRGKTVTVSVVYQYDSGFSAMTGTFRKSIRVP